MSRAFSLASGVLALAAAAGCTSVKCGPGTERAQDDNGDIVCKPVAVTAGTTECDPDAGVMLVDGNKCQATLQCGPGTKLDVGSQRCIPVTQGAHDPPVCATPAAGHICANGTLRNLVDGSFLSGQTVTITFYDASQFFFTPNPPKLAEVDASDTYMVPSIATPQYLLAITHDTSAAPGTYQATGIALATTTDGIYRLDAYVLKQAEYNAWGLPASYETRGTLFYRFFDDPKPPANARTPTEMNPVMGVVLKNGSSVDAAARYFGSSLASIDGAATMTGPTGGVITTITGSEQLDTFTGTGGGITWEGHMGLPIANVVQVDFLHPH
jgi:hypothetical protein